MQKNSAKKIETTRGSVMSKSDSERSSDEVTETKPTYNTRKQRATNPKKRQRNARGDAGNEKKRVKTNGGTPSRRSRKWYTSYKGALAFALFKVKTWMLRDTGFLDVTLQADKKKYGGSVYDWDIVYLGMKIIQGELVRLDTGINAARKYIKSHAMIEPYVAEWRKTRTVDDEKMKEIFQTTHVQTQSDLDKFIEEHKEWSQEEEDTLVNELLARIKNEPLQDTSKSSKQSKRKKQQSGSSSNNSGLTSTAEQKVAIAKEDSAIANDEDATVEDTETDDNSNGVTDEEDNALTDNTMVDSMSAFGSTDFEHLVDNDLPRGAILEEDEFIDILTPQQQQHGIEDMNILFGV